MVPARAGDGDGTERGRLALAIGSRLAAGLRRLRGPAGTMAGQAGRRGREAKPARSRISRSRRRPLPGDFDPARLRGNVDRDETSPQSPSLETNGFAERTGLAETHLQTHGHPGSARPLRVLLTHPFGTSRQATKPRVHKASPCGGGVGEADGGGVIGRWPVLRSTIPKLPPPIAARSPPPRGEALFPYRLICPAKYLRIPAP